MNNLNAYPEIYMPCPFAGEADNSGTEGTNRSKPFSDSKSNANVNMRTGFPSVFTLAQSANGKYLSRPDMNQLGYLATVGHFRRQIGCLNEFNSTFAGTIGGYAKGAVLDYVVRDGASADSPIKEVWKIMSLGDKEGNGVKLAPSSSSIADFNTKLSDIKDRDKVQWLRIVPDKAYLDALQAECHQYTDTEVGNEKTRAEGVEAQKIDTDTANKQFAGTSETYSDYTKTDKNEKFRIDGTARDKDGVAVDANVCKPDAGKTETAYSQVLGRDVKIARYGHIHTNMYTKAEVDAKIQSMGGMYAAGRDQDTGYHDGTYTNYGGTIKGHKHDENARGAMTLKGGIYIFDPKDGTARTESGVPTNNKKNAESGHVHENYATTDYVNTLIQQAGPSINVVRETNSVYIELPNKLVMQYGTTSVSVGTQGSVSTRVATPLYANVRTQIACGGDDADYGCGCKASANQLVWMVYAGKIRWDQGTSLYWCVIGFN